MGFLERKFDGNMTEKNILLAHCAWYISKYIIILTIQTKIVLTKIGAGYNTQNLRIMYTIRTSIFRLAHELCVNIINIQPVCNHRLYLV